MADTQAAPALSGQSPYLGPSVDVSNLDSATHGGIPHQPSLPASAHHINDLATSYNNSGNASPIAGTTDETHDHSNSPLPSSSATTVKGEETAASAPYGTRSRIRPGVPRPNYSDDVELNFEMAHRKVESTEVKRANPLESVYTVRPSTEMATDQPRDFTAANQRRPQNNGIANVLENGVSVTPPADGTQSKSKRKYTWKGASTAPDLRQNSIPGVSQFSTNSDTSDPPTKKRKTGDHVVNGSSSASVPATALRKMSSHSTKAAARESCIVSFERTGALPNNGKLCADDGTTYGVDDHVYLICEPPGDPYYLCRIMGLRRGDPDDPKSPITSLLVNWFYRPKDLGRFSVDSRLLYASMQSDEAPLMSLRAKCTIKHRSEIGPSQAELDDYKRQRDAFWFTELYDRYIHRPYNMVPAKAVINVPKNVKKAIDERWKYLVVEPTRLKELTSAVKLCKRCSGYCAPNDSVDCGVCRNTYHMTCVNPPLAKKPSRGFAWSCGPCSRAQEKRLEARHASGTAEDEEVREDEEEAGAIQPEAELESSEKMPPAPMTHNQAEAAKASMWPWRYLGIHCNVEDVLQYDDRAIYPRASSRLGARHQAVVNFWYGRPVELVKPTEIKKKYSKGATNKKDAKLTKETVAAIEADKAERAKRPPWMQDEPPGYIPRGEDYESSDPRCTAERLFVVPPEETAARVGFAAVNAAKPVLKEAVVDAFMEKAKALATERGFARPISEVSKEGSRPGVKAMAVSTNYFDRSLTALHKNSFNTEAALEELRTLNEERDIGNPMFSSTELKKFEDGVSKFGSELRLVKKHVKTRPYGEITRLYYIWKKTPRGKEIWGRHAARRGSKRRAETSWPEIADDEDDSAFDNAKASQRKRKFQCKFCLSTTSRQWRRAPAIAPGATVTVNANPNPKDKMNQYVVALCQRCAYPWRRYGIQWDDPEEYAKSLNQPGGRQWKRLQDEMMLRELVLANEAAHIPTTGLSATAAASIGITLTVPVPDTTEQAKKKSQSETQVASVQAPAEPPKKKVTVAPPPRPPTPPIVPNQPIMRLFPCAVCWGNDTVDFLISCSSCKLTVHRHCYAIPEQANAAKWTCDTCANDKNNIYSLDHRCVLCTVHERAIEMVEQPKVSHKKKNEREREKERLEKQLADDLALKYKREQLSKGRPVLPREAVKHTTSNNWMHVVCAVWTPEIKFGKAAELDDAEGIGAVMANPSRLNPLCKLCRVPNTGSTVACHQDKCAATFHVGCAHDAGYRLGFDIKPVKGSKKDGLATLAFGAETGLMTAVIYCNDHDPAATPILHNINERNEKGIAALEAFVETYKQADTTLTGTARKANMLTQSNKAIANAAPAVVSAPAGRRSSLIHNPKARRASAASPAEEVEGQVTGEQPLDPAAPACTTCGTDVSFRWWPAPDHARNTDDTHLADLTNGGIEQAKDCNRYQCHKCHMSNDDVNPTPPPSDRGPDDDEEAEMEPDMNFFTLTMPRAPIILPSLGAGIPVHYCLPPYVPGFNERYSQVQQAAQVPEQDQRERHIDTDIDMWTRHLWSSTFVLTMPNGQAIHIRGQEFGSPTDPPAQAWQHLVRRATDAGRYDNNSQVIVTETGGAITNEKSFVEELADIIKHGAREVHWHVQDKNLFPLPQQWHPPMHGPQPVQPPAGPDQPHGRAALQHRHSGSRPPSTGPSPTAFSFMSNGTYQRPQSASQTRLPQAFRRDSMSSNERPSPKFPGAMQLPSQTRPQVRQQTPQEPSNIAPELRGSDHPKTTSSNLFDQPRSPPVATSTIQTDPESSKAANGVPAPQAVGASTSPNLKNLMHS